MAARHRFTGAMYLKIGWFLGPAVISRGCVVNIAAGIIQTFVKSQLNVCFVYVNFISNDKPVLNVISPIQSYILISKIFRILKLLLGPINYQN